MSRFLSETLAALTPYTPGEQPQGGKFIKLNTNESPYPPAPAVADILAEEDAAALRLYSDPAAADLTAAIAEYWGVGAENVFVGNGSDEVLAFAFQAFGRGRRMVFPDITYAFYSVFAGLFGIEARQIPLNERYEIVADDYLTAGEMVVIANPNAITGLNLPLSEIERILQAHPCDVVLVDEAYVDFGGQSAASLIDKYDNLLVVQTFSKSRQLAGARVGLALASAGLIADMNTVKFSFNPYNVNRLSQKLAAAAMRDKAYFEECCAKIVADREFTARELGKLGFEVLPGLANFLLVRSDKIGGEAYYAELKRRGILVRWFDEERIRDFVRITIGNREEMAKLIEETTDILANR